MQLLVFEDAGYRGLLPLVFSRATFNLRCGFDNLLSKIETATGRTAEAVVVRNSLAAVLAERQTRRVNQPSTSDDQLWINGRFLLRAAPDLPMQSAVWRDQALVAARLPRALACKLTPDVVLDPARLQEALAACAGAELDPQVGTLIDHPWELVHENAVEIARQFARQKPERAGQVDGRAHLLGAAIHVGAGSRVMCGAVIDAESGPVWIGENVTIHPCAVVHGPCFIGDGCTVKAHAAISAASIGMVCKVGGEIEGSIFHGYSNKQHDGFLGHSYVGEWVNLGAATVNSDLKNTYSPVKVAINGVLVDSGSRLVGAFIGDHTKTGIGTRLSTGCVVGYACNLLCSEVTPKFVPSFTWLDASGAAGLNDPVRAFETAQRVVARRNRSLSAAEEKLFFSIVAEAKAHEKTV